MKIALEFADHSSHVTQRTATSLPFTWLAKQSNEFSNRTCVFIRPKFLTRSSSKQEVCSNFGTRYSLHQCLHKSRSSSRKTSTQIFVALHFNPVQRYPSEPNNCSLSESFAEYFSDKIVKIRKDLDNVDGSLNDGQVTSCSAGSERCLAEQLLSEFKLVNEEVVSGFVNHLWSKSCTLDPIPSSVFKRCRHYLLPVITRIVNLSLTSGQVPDRFKVAMLKPLLKKSGADHEVFSNFRPVSNLHFLSKVTEKAVAAQLMGHLNDNEGLLEEFQSAYKSHHSTETALVKVQNDILKAIDNNRSVILLLLDLSAAFDTVDHSILLSRLQDRFGIRNTALKWFHSYLDSREQFVSVNGIESSKKHLPYGVPQGSVLGPLLYSLCTSPLGDIARKHSIPFHFYADDTQLFYFYLYLYVSLESFTLLEFSQLNP